MFFVLLIHTTVMMTVIAQHNLTRYGTASQSSNIYGNYGNPSNAIEPPISNQYSLDFCSHTYVSRTNGPAWWRFMFSYTYAYITDITIYYREGWALRMDGFKLCLTNTSTTPPVSDFCYTDPDPGLPNIIQTIPFNHFAKYVIYYDNKGSTNLNGRVDGPVIELCYVAINGCQKGFWGINCTIKCAENCIEGNCFPGNGSCVWGCDPSNCLNNVCNKDTAECTNGCKEGRTGNHCNKYNLASYSLVTQNPSGSLPARLAIDGDKTSCSKTQGQIVTFQVDLNKARAVTEMFLIFVEHITTVGDHIIYASNTSSSWKDGIILYQGKALPAEVNLSTVFRYLTFEPLPQQDFVILELCEIGVIGCPPGHYGSNCTKSCPINCQGPCEPENGNCAFRCLSGWTGQKCGQACNGGKYGKDCLQECSANCLNPPCYHITGECSNGCNDGWLGSNCTQKCPKGHFGQKCLKSCDGCLSNLCEHIEGLCFDKTACKPGYVFGEYCNTACVNGSFGTNCSDFCDGCLSVNCNHVDGLCDDKNACNAGYVFGDHCNKECTIGQFGTNCSEICKGCRSYMCDNADGLCDDTDTCNPGYFYGDYCNKVCDDYYFGNNCTKQCHCLEKPCNNDDGICSPEGCKEGWHGTCGKSCDQVCDDWFFGNNCAWKCYCLTGPCNQFTGKCPPGGCQKGWHGVACKGFLLGILMATTACFLARKRRKLTKKQVVMSGSIMMMFEWKIYLHIKIS